MPEETRSTLFVSYSRVDVGWRDMFLRHLRESFTHDTLWVDTDSIDAGSNDLASIAEGVRRARYALLLLTPNYLDRDHFVWTEERRLLVAEQDRGLTLLPVLVEPCRWDEEPDLKDIELVRWPDDGWPADAASSRPPERAICEAGMESATEPERASARDRAVLAVCSRVAEKFGIGRRLTRTQSNALPRQTEDASRDHRRLTMEDEPRHPGEFALVYKGLLDDEPVAVKVIPTAAWRDRVDRALTIATTAKRLRNPTFIRVEQVISDAEVQAVVMQYIDWPTLDDRLAGYEGRRLPPSTVVRLLRKVAEAQREAHDCDVPIGALSTRSIYVDDDWDIRLSPFRIEAHLARALTLSTDHLVSWDVLAMLTPEVYEGHQPVLPRDMDAQGQYYLGLLGLELLLGRRPLEITCFRDLVLTSSRFFDDPRAFFDGTDEGVGRWTDECPSLAFVLARMLARRPGDRLESAEEVGEELRRIDVGELPGVLRRCVEDDYVAGAVGRDFAARFYDRLFTIHPLLRDQFGAPAEQAAHLAEALRDLVEFEPTHIADRFLDRVDEHRAVTPADADTFRHAFVEEVVATCGRPAGPLSARTRGDAWNAVLKAGIEVMLRRTDGSATAGPP